MKKIIVIFALFSIALGQVALADTRCKILPDGAKYCWYDPDYVDPRDEAIRRLNSQYQLPSAEEQRRRIQEQRRLKDLLLDEWESRTGKIAPPAERLF